MTGGPRMVVTLAVFAAMLVLMMLRPRRWSEAWWTMLAAIAMLALGLVTPHEALAAVLSGKNTLLFLLSLLALSQLIGKSGFFDWAAIRCARIAKGDAHALYRNAFVVGAIITAILSLDTTAVMLTPVMLALVKRLKVPAAPYVLLCAFVANVGSLLLPISNLTNLLFADAFHQTFAAFAARMILPQIVALVTTYAILRWHFRRSAQRLQHQVAPRPGQRGSKSHLLSCLHHRPCRSPRWLLSGPAPWARTLRLRLCGLRCAAVCRHGEWARTHSIRPRNRMGFIPVRHWAFHCRAGA